MHVDLCRAHVRADHQLVMLPPGPPELRVPEVREDMVQPNDLRWVVEDLAMAVIGGDHDGGMRKELLDASCGLEHVAENAVDTLDHRQRHDGADLVTDVIVVGEVGNGEVPEPVLVGEIAHHHAGRGVVHAEPMQEARLAVHLALARPLRNEVAETQKRWPFDGLGKRHAR